MSESIRLTGTITTIMNETVVSEKFRKREFVLEHAPNPQYPELLKIEFVNDKCQILDNYSVNDIVDVDINLKGRKWNSPDGETKYFITIQAWRIQKQDDVPF